MDLRTIGVKAYLDNMSGAQTGEFARQVERWGYSALWLAEVPGRRGTFAHAAYLLACTERLVLGTSIANIWLREPAEMVNEAQALAELFPDRFVLGLGVSHETVLSGQGLKYERPLSFMRQYLDRMAQAPAISPPPAAPPPLLLAALMPRMLQLARERSQGTVVALGTVEHTRRMRAVLGPDKWIVTQVIATLESDPAVARAQARGATGNVNQPNYRRSLLSVGFEERDLQNGGSDRLVDAVAAWGGTAQIRARVEEHYAAGASHVCLTFRGPLRPEAAPMRTLAAMAPAKA